MEFPGICLNLRKYKKLNDECKDISSNISIEKNLEYDENLGKLYQFSPSTTLLKIRLYSNRSTKSKLTAIIRRKSLIIVKTIYENWWYVSWWGLEGWTQVTYTNIKY